MKKILIYSAQNDLARELITAGRQLGNVCALALDEAAVAALAAAGVDVLRYANSAVSPADTAATARVVALA